MGSVCRIEENEPENTWFRLALLEAMLFEPYYALSTEKDKNGNDVPCKKYKELTLPLAGYKTSAGDEFIDKLFTEKPYYNNGCFPILHFSKSTKIKAFCHYAYRKIIYCYFPRSMLRTFSRRGRTNGGDTESSSIPMRRNVSVSVRSDASSPQMPIHALFS